MLIFNNLIINFILSKLDTRFGKIGIFIIKWSLIYFWRFLNLIYLLRFLRHIHWWSKTGSILYVLENAMRPFTLFDKLLFKSFISWKKKNIFIKLFPITPEWTYFSHLFLWTVFLSPSILLWLNLWIVQSMFSAI